MPGTHCCVRNCFSSTHDYRGKRRDHVLRFFRIPTWKKHEGEHVSDVTRRRRMSWVAAIRRKDITFDRISQSMRVCSLHFHSGKPSYEMLENHPDWKPSLRLGHSDVKKTDEARFQRLVKRRTQHQEQLLLPPQHLEQPPCPAQHPEQAPPLVQHQEQPPCPAQEQAPPSAQQPHQEPAQECALCPYRRDVINSLLEENRKLKEELEEYRMNENFLSGDDNRVKYYTGLPNYLTFQTLLLSLTPYLPQGRLKKLSPFQLVLLTLMRLRLDLPIQHLGRLLRVHRTTASDAFHHTLSVMYSRLSPLVYWPSRESLMASMPHKFVESFGGNAAAIVDCFEVFIEKPSNALARAQTFSQHKHAHTMKYLIVVTPQGVISFISEGWGGHASDKHITEQSGFLDKLMPGDVVLTDRGFDIGESVGMMCAEVKVPPRGRAQLEARDVEEAGATAHLRIHVERMIGVVQNAFKFLRSTVPVNMLLKCEGENVMALDKIVTVCCALTNMCPSVV
ncbi:hypothetical protein EPR50_G00071550 [Perca flavescens]|uniref:THAP-type domain-containing protein n=1 Tax=Perca flavescens TaxID=8167 RepID=A0A484D4G2_PERFV|nr:uncharacterized protein LOC114559107 [Perca flavescens]TDH10114.1 hypothetical protein EPR50_G00071550 [Perca flavescens]